MINGIVIVVLIMVVIFAIKGTLHQFVYGCCGSKDVEKKIKVKDKRPEAYPYYAVIGVDGMKCRQCKLHVENAFNEKDGNWAEVDLGKKEAKVRMKTKMTDREIRDTVSKAGYVLKNIEWKQDLSQTSEELNSH